MKNLPILAFIFLCTSLHAKDLATVRAILNTTLNSGALAEFGYFSNSKIIEAVKLNSEINGMSNKQLYSCIDKSMQELGFGKYYVALPELPHAVQRRHGLAPYNGTDVKVRRGENFRRSIFIRDNNLENVPKEIRDATYSGYITGGMSEGDPAITRVLGVHEPSTRVNVLEEDLVQDFLAKLRNMKLVTPTGEPVLSLLLEIRAENMVNSLGRGCRGHADMCFYYPNPKFHGLMLEWKTPTNGLSQSQIMFRDLIQKQGYKYYVVRSANEGVNAIKRYMNNEMESREKLN